MFGVHPKVLLKICGDLVVRFEYETEKSRSLRRQIYDVMLNRIRNYQYSHYLSSDIQSK